MQHEKGRCPAHNAKCYRCHRKGHFARNCLATAGRGKVVGEIHEKQTAPEPFIGTVTHDNERGATPWEVQLKIADCHVNFKIDCGADVSVMSERQYNRLQRRPSLRDTGTTLTGVGNRIKCIGMFSTTTIYRGKQYSLDIYVIPGSVNHLLSRADRRTRRRWVSFSQT